MPLQATSGAASYDAFGGGVPFEPTYIEQIFQTWLYTGNGSTQTITNGIDLAGEGGLVWVKQRDAANGHILVDTVRGGGNYLQSNTTGANEVNATVIPTFTATGFNTGGAIDSPAKTYASWTFRKAPKFFDVVTYTGNGAGPQVINHNLGSAPGCVIVKSVSNTSVWWVWHRGNGGSTDLTGIELNSTNASTFQNAGVASDFTATTFNAGSLINVALNLNPNVNGQTYVAYLFAHDAGGFGLTGTDNVISCGSYVGNGSTDGPTVTLGYEPQWILVKNTTGAADWWIVDNMRGMPVGGNDWRLRPNTSDEDNNGDPFFAPTATGFKLETLSSNVNTSGSTYIYIAIRRGPMKVPTTGTSVFSPIQAAGGTGTKLTTNFPVDFQIWALPGDGGSSKRAVDRLRGVSSNTTTSGVALFTDLTSAEDPASVSTRYWDNTGYTIPDNFLGSGLNAIYWNFRRAPGFMDVCCYTGTGTSGQTFSHNLGVVPEMMIVKRRNGDTNWFVYHQAIGNTDYLMLNQTSATNVATSLWNDTTPTASVFTVGNGSAVNSTGNTFVNYLFASCPGVSKVGSYTGNGSSQTINCGFTGGARFVLIKRTDSTGDWYVWDTARGIVSGNDPHLSLNTTAAEVTSNDTIDTDSTGFVVNQVSATNVNVSSATYIFLAIA